MISKGCYQCTERHSNCHSSCKRYEEYLKEYHARKKYIQDICDSCNATIYQLTKERRLH